MMTSTRSVVGPSVALLAVAVPSALGSGATPGRMIAALPSAGTVDVGFRTASDTAPTWVRPPMKMSGPMLPGLENERPGVRPFLPGSDRPADLVPSGPSETVHLSEGDTLLLEAEPVGSEIGGRLLPMYGFDGQSPGPTLVVKRGGHVVVRLVNHTELPTSLHWHGVRVPNAADGVTGLTQDPVAPGKRFDYDLEFPDVGVFWYHPHHHQTIGQDLGLYGAIRVIPDRADDTSTVDREAILLLDDLLVGEDGLEPWGLEAPTHAFMGRFGNQFLINGRSDFRLAVVAGETVRFHLVNAANTRVMNIRFGDRPMRLIGTDLSRFEREQRVESAVLGPGQRYTVDVAFDAPGSLPIINDIQAIDHYRGSFYRRIDTVGVVEVSDGGGNTGHPSIFDDLRTARDVRRSLEPFRKELDRPVDRVLTIGARMEGLPTPVARMLQVDTMYAPPVEMNDVMPMMNWLSTGRNVRWYLYEGDPRSKSDDLYPATGWHFTEGDVVKLRIHNDPRSPHPMHHPIHVHGQRFLVVERDGVPTSNFAWKDTVIVPVGSTVDLLVEMSNPGQWMINCQIPEHLESGMSMTFNVYPAPVGEK